MADDAVMALFETFNLLLILLAFVIFTRLAFKGKGLGNFRFQLSIFLLIWVISEIPHIAESVGLIATSGYEDLGLYLHALSMGVFALFVGWRSLKFVTLHPTPPTGMISVPTEQPKGLKG
ncbi:hypothetical protein E6H18_05490 [Candidatus Bathyarchaeota archaeon]|nr:MAG: hypothetical protein E6H18_05490 [Candidatus Bathyarchaeota archaeon]